MNENEPINVNVDERTELLFRVRVEGAGATNVRTRLVCESGDVAYMIAGSRTDDGDMVRFVVPAMTCTLPEGSCSGRIEVFVGDRCFVPLEFPITLGRSTRVMAETVDVRRTPMKPIVTAAAVQKAAPERSTLDESAILNAAAAFVNRRRRTAGR